jgi:hypothetical protein
VHTVINYFSTRSSFRKTVNCSTVCFCYVFNVLSAIKHIGDRS